MQRTTSEPSCARQTLPPALLMLSLGHEVFIQELSGTEALAWQQQHGLGILWPENSNPDACLTLSSSTQRSRAKGHDVALAWVMLRAPSDKAATVDRDRILTGPKHTWVHLSMYVCIHV